MARATAQPSARPAILRVRCPGTSGSADFGMSYKRRSDVRSERTYPDDRPAPRCGTEQSHRAPCDAPMQSATCAFPKICCPLRGRCRPPRGWAGSSLHQPPGPLHFIGTRNLDGFERTGNRLQMAAGQMQVESGIADLGMAEQYLNGAQVGAGFQHVCREAVAKQMRRHALLDAGALASLVYGLPHNLRSNGHIRPPVVDRAWEQVGLGLHPAAVLTQRLQQLGAQENIATHCARGPVD